jgi:hypothetical protein
MTDNCEVLIMGGRCGRSERSPRAWATLAPLKAAVRNFSVGSLLIWPAATALPALSEVTLFSVPAARAPLLESRPPGSV